MNDYIELMQTIKTVEDEDLREKLLVGVKVLTEGHTVRLRDLAEEMKGAEKSMRMLKTFKVVAVAYMNDIFARRELAGDGNQALIGIFNSRMNDCGYELRDGEWREIEGFDFEKLKKV